MLEELKLSVIDAGKKLKEYKLITLTGGNVSGRIAARDQVVAQQRGLDGAIVVALAPVAEVAVAEAIGPRCVREQHHDAALRCPFRA